MTTAFKEIMLEMARNYNRNQIQDRLMDDWEDRLFELGYTMKQIQKAAQRLMDDEHQERFPTRAQFFSRLGAKKYQAPRFWWTSDGAYGGDPSDLSEHEAAEIATYVLEFHAPAILDSDKEFYALPRFLIDSLDPGAYDRYRLKMEDRAAKLEALKALPL